MTGREETTMEKVYESKSARDAQSAGYGGEGYWDYLDETAMRLRDTFLERGDTAQAELMMTRSLGEALAGNDGA
jgi:hypothetical protein